LFINLLKVNILDYLHIFLLKKMNETVKSNAAIDENIIENVLWNHSSKHSSLSPEHTHNTLKIATLTRINFIFKGY
ncbi:hypothetical protein, partial [Akkermansia sp.]